ncbi:carbohydrate ABC transporter substrate-binding protein, partial [Streptomyces althioticus]
MGTLGSLRRKAVATAAAVGALSLVVGCGGDGDSVTGGSKDGDKVTITMGLFGVMGIKETGLLEEYEKNNPGVTIKAEIAGDEQTYYTALQTKLAAGKGLKDIQGIEIGRAKEITETRADKF